MAAMDQFVPINQAGKLFGISASTLRKRCSDRTIQTYQSDADRRMVLVRIDDVRKLADPRPNTQEADTLSAA